MYASSLNDADDYNLQPGLNGALFYWWQSLSKPTIKKAGVLRRAQYKFQTEIAAQIIIITIIYQVF